MSRKASVHPSTVVEWSPKRVAIIDPTTRSAKAFATAQEAVANIGAQAVVAAVSRRAMFVRTLRVPNTARAEIDTIVRMKMADLFPIPPEDLAYSLELTGDLTAEGRLAVISAMPANELRKLHDELKSAGFRVHAVVPIAYGSVVLAHALNQGTCAIASKDESGIGIDIVQDGVLRYSRVAPVTAAVASEVCRTYSVAGMECGEIVVTEGLKVDDADVVSAISPLEALSGEWPCFVPELELPETVILRTTKATAAKRRLAAILFLAGILLAAFAYLEYMDQVTAAAKAKEAMDTSLAKLKEQKSLTEKETSTAIAIQGSLRRALQPAQQPSEIVAVVANRAPADVWITGIGVERGKQVTVRGTARSSEGVAEFLRNLTAADAQVVSGGDTQRVSRFRDVKLVFATNAKIDETTVVQFSVSATPVGNVPLIELKKGTTKK